MTERNKIAVVLGSGLQSDGSATPVTELRARRAATFLRKHPMTLILSGSRSPLDHGEHGKTEASVMAEIVRAQGIETPLLLEDQSFDTLGNAIFTSRRYLQSQEPGTLYIITSPFHMERAKYVFGHVLGHRWRIRGSKCREWQFETRHRKSDDALLRARAFFEDIESGDLEACENKLIELIPAYSTKLAS